MVSIIVLPILQYIKLITDTHTFRFLQYMSGGWVFITFAVLLRLTEGVGSSMAITAIYTLLPELFPNRVGLVTVTNRHL